MRRWGVTVLPIQLKSFPERVASVLGSLTKKPQLLMIAGLCGILLIFASSLLGRGSDEKTSADSSAPITAQEYCSVLEEGVRQLVADITGDSDATVVITLESGVRYSYADATEVTSSNATSGENGTESHNETRSYVTVRTSDGGEQALLITELMPQVRGVAIICSGGDDEQLAEKIRGAVTAAFDITSKRVYIAGGNGYEKR